jgi:virulence factor Mce-like protein
VRLRGDIRRWAPVAGFGALVVTVLVLLMTGGGSSHTLRAAFTSAVQVVPGQEVRLAGRRIGDVRSVSVSGGHAVVAMRIDDDAWPLRRGTTARLRFGLPLTYGARYIDLHPGPGDEPPLADGGILPTDDTISPVEFDQLYRMLGPRTRRNFQGLLANASTTLAGHQRDIAAAVTQGGQGLDQLSLFFADLGADAGSLRTLVQAGAATTSALAVRDRALGAAVAHAGTTFEALAQHARALQATLGELPPALSSGSRTLVRLDHSLSGLQALVSDVRPGATGLRAIAPTVQRAVVTLRTVAPLATTTLQVGRRRAPEIRRFLTTATPFMPTLSSTLRGLAPMAACVRPYGPEIASMFSTWGSYSANFDRLGHYARDSVQSPVFPAGTQQSSKQIADELGDRVRYAFPPPPGWHVGQPWFIPQCGITKAVLDPSRDPEAKR